METRLSEIATDNIPLLGLAPNTVSLCSHEPMWRQCYLDEEQAIIDVLGPDILRLEHIGSTCIPHIMAKPTIDMVGGIRSFADVPGLIAPLGGLGYEYLGDGIVHGHHVFGKGTFRTHLLHVVEIGGVRWRELRTMIFCQPWRCIPGPHGCIRFWLSRTCHSPQAWPISCASTRGIIRPSSSLPHAPSAPHPRVT